MFLPHAQCRRFPTLFLNKLFRSAPTIFRWAPPPWFISTITSLLSGAWPRPKLSHTIPSVTFPISNILRFKSVNNNVAFDALLRGAGAGAVRRCRGRSSCTEDPDRVLDVSMQPGPEPTLLLPLCLSFSCALSTEHCVVLCVLFSPLCLSSAFPSGRLVWHSPELQSRSYVCKFFSEGGA